MYDKKTTFNLIFGQGIRYIIIVYLYKLFIRVLVHISPRAWQKLTLIGGRSFDCFPVFLQYYD